MKCPRDGSQLKPLGISYVCPRCSYKKVRPDKHKKLELSRVASFPYQPADNWEDWTYSTFVSDGTTYDQLYHYSSYDKVRLKVLSIDPNIGKVIPGTTEGSMTSPAFTNLTRSTTVGLYNITKVKIEYTTWQDADNGRINFWASNDGGVTWTPVKANGHTHSLNHGNEGDVPGGYAQTKYNDLRIKIDFWSATATTADFDVLETLTVHYNYKKA